MGLWPEGNQDAGSRFWPRDRAEQLGEILGWIGAALVYAIIFWPILLGFL